MAAPSKMNIKLFIAWCSYDWAGSAFSVIVITFIFAPYFTSYIASNPILGTHEWANAISLAAIIIAITSPLMGAIADYTGNHKTGLISLTCVPIISSAMLWFAYPHPAYVTYTLIWVVVGTVGSEIGYVFYNSYLSHLAPPEYIGRISGWAWGASFIGGVVILCIALFGFVQLEPAWLDTTTGAQIRITGPLVALWTLVFSIPFFIYIPTKESRDLPFSSAIKLSCRELLITLRLLVKEKNILLYLISHSFFEDGLNSLIAFGGIYAVGTFHMSISEVILLGILMNCLAGLGAFIFAWFDDSVGSKNTLMLSLIFLFIFGMPLLIIKTSTAFWMLALSLSIFLGPVQAAGRSLMARLTRPEKAAEYFGLFAFTGKATAFLGPLFFGWATYLFNTQRAGMATILIFLLVGGLLLSFVKEVRD